MRETERYIMLHVIDTQWKDHLLSMDHLKEGNRSSRYGQKDPLIEYKKESFTMFQDMMDRIEDESIRYLFFLQVNDDSGDPDGVPCFPSIPRMTMVTKNPKKSPSLSPPSSARPPSQAWRLHPQHPAQERQGTRRPPIRRRRLHHQNQPSSKATKSAAMTLAPAEAAKNTRSVTEHNRLRRCLIVKMPKYVALFLCVVSTSQAAIWPERLAGSNRTKR